MRVSLKEEVFGNVSPQYVLDHLTDEIYNFIQNELSSKYETSFLCYSSVNNVYYHPHLGIKCMGRGSYARTRLDKYGFPRLYFSPNKKAFGFQTGDIVKTIVKIKGVVQSIIGKIAIRQRGQFNLTVSKEIKSVRWYNCQLIQHADGYSYAEKEYNFYIANNNLLTIGNI